MWPQTRSRAPSALSRRRAATRWARRRGTPSEKPASPSTSALYLSLPCIFLTATDKIEGAFSAVKEKGSHALGKTEGHAK